jgi:hypothetical protein
VKRRQFIALIGGAAAAWRRSSGLLNPLSAARRRTSWGPFAAECDLDYLEGVTA